MNGKRARALRKFVGAKDITTYTESEHVAWGPLPRNKKTKKVDRKAMQKLMDKSPNPKFTTFNGINKFGNLVPEKLFRYIIGTPKVMKLDCWRKQYQLLKNSCVVA